jgi:hypothetical protein
METLWAQLQSLLDLKRGFRGPRCGGGARGRQAACAYHGRDLAEALRLQIHDDDPSRVAAAYMERSDDISVITRHREN